MAQNPAPLPPPSRLALVREIAIDGSLVGGVGLIAVGTWQLSPPAAFIAVGVMLIAAGINGARR